MLGHSGGLRLQSKSWLESLLSPPYGVTKPPRRPKRGLRLEKKKLFCSVVISFLFFLAETE